MTKESMNLTMERELKKQFKVACLTRDTTMSDVVTALVQRWLADPSITDSPEQNETEDTRQDTRQRKSRNSGKS